MQNIVGTLAKVAVGALLDRGVGKMMSGSNSSSGSQSGLGGLLGSVLGGSPQGLGGQSGLGGLAGKLGGLLGGGQSSGAAQSQTGGLGSLLDGLGIKSQAEHNQTSGASLGGLLNAALRGESIDDNVSEETDQEAQILLQAMIAAAKSDGRIDESEQARILGKMGDISAVEQQFLQDEIATPFDMEAFIRTIPAGMEQQVYLMSLIAIDLDSQAEARYLDQLRRGLHLSEQQCNAIHQKLGAPSLYH